MGGKFRANALFWNGERLAEFRFLQDNANHTAFAHMVGSFIEHHDFLRKFDNLARHVTNSVQDVIEVIQQCAV